MKHKYPVGTWVRFYRANELVIAVVEYLPLRGSWEDDMSYHTTEGTVKERSILEARLP